MGRFECLRNGAGVRKKAKPQILGDREEREAAGRDRVRHKRSP